MKEDELIKHLKDDPHSKQITPFVLIHVFNEDGKVLLFKEKKNHFLDFGNLLVGI